MAKDVKTAKTKGYFAGMIPQEAYLKKDITERVDISLLSDEARMMVQRARFLESSARNSSEEKANDLYRKAAELYVKAGELPLKERGDEPGMVCDVKTALYHRAATLFAKADDFRSEADCYRKIGDAETDANQREIYHSMASDLEELLNTGDVEEVIRFKKAQEKANKSRKKR